MATLSEPNLLVDTFSREAKKGKNIHCSNYMWIASPQHQINQIFFCINIANIVILRSLRFKDFTILFLKMGVP